MVRNRFTIDTDLVFHGNNNNSHDLDPPLSHHALLQSHKPQGEDTDRWVEEQFDLGRYEEPGEGVVKETDILSDDDEYCKSVRAASAEPTDLDAKMEGLDLQSRNLNGRLEPGGETIPRDSVDSYVSLSRCSTPSIKLAPLKQCAVEGAANKDHDVIWVRRDDFANGCNSDVF